MTTTNRFQAEGLHCSACSMLITISVQELDGVAEVVCNHATGRTDVTFDERVVDASQIREAIVLAGYQAQLVG